jgi:hypothetical protein
VASHFSLANLNGPYFLYSLPLFADALLDGVVGQSPLLLVILQSSVVSLASFDPYGRILGGRGACDLERRCLCLS